LNGLYTPKHVADNKQVDKPWTKWKGRERRRTRYDCTAKNILTSSLNMDKWFKIFQCKCAKDMWDVLEVTHAATNDVKRARKHALIQEIHSYCQQSHRFG